MAFTAATSCGLFRDPGYERCRVTQAGLEYRRSNVTVSADVPWEDAKLGQVYVAPSGCAPGDELANG